MGRFSIDDLNFGEQKKSIYNRLVHLLLIVGLTSLVIAFLFGGVFGFRQTLYATAVILLVFYLIVWWLVFTFGDKIEYLFLFWLHCLGKILLSLAVVTLIVQIIALILFTHEWRHVPFALFVMPFIVLGTQGMPVDKRELFTTEWPLNVDPSLGTTFLMFGMELEAFLVLGILGMLISWPIDKRYQELNDQAFRHNWFFRRFGRTY